MSPGLFSIKLTQNITQWFDGKNYAIRKAKKWKTRKHLIIYLIILSFTNIGCGIFSKKNKNALSIYV